MRWKNLVADLFTLLCHDVGSAACRRARPAHGIDYEHDSTTRRNNCDSMALIRLEVLVLLEILLTIAANNG